MRSIEWRNAVCCMAVELCGTTRSHVTAPLRGCAVQPTVCRHCPANTLHPLTGVSSIHQRAALTSSAASTSTTAVCLSIQMQATSGLIMVTHCIFTDSVRRVGKAIGSVHLSFRPFVSTLSFEPTNLWTWVCVCKWVMAIIISPGIKSQGHGSRSKGQCSARMSVVTQ